MAKKLYLRLNYKGKPLDFAWEGREVKKRFFIGSNKYLSWQILDDSFPDRHQFVTQKGSEYVMTLPPGAKLSCSKDNNPVDSSYLTQNSILRGSELQLRPDLTGTVAIAPNWEVSFEYKEPWITVLTAEEKQIAAQYSRYAELSAFSRFNRNLILLFVFLTVVLLMIYDLAFKKQFSYDETLEAKLKTLQKAELVRAENLKKTSSMEYEQEADTGDQPAEPQPQGQTQQGTATGGQGSAQSAGAIFGASFGKFDPNATSSAPKITAVTTAEGFVTARPGRGGGGGGGSGPGGSGPGGGGGYNATFDPSAGQGFSSDIGSVVTNAPKVAGYSARPDAGVVVKASGDQSKLAPSGVAFGTTAKSSQLLSSFSAKNVQKVTEASIAEAPAEARTRYEVIGNTVNTLKQQVQTLYQKWNAITPFSGSVTTRLLIDSSGKVQSAIITPNGQVPTGFLSDMKAMCETWRFNVNQESDYTFTLRLRKG